MDKFEIRVFKTQGGTGSDAWSASFSMGDGPSHMEVSARGESRESARQKLAFQLREFNRQLCGAIGEIEAKVAA